MNLNEGLTKIIKEYPSIREYANIKKKKEKGLFNQEMENKKKEYSNFLSEFRESIEEFVLNNSNMHYNVKYSSLAQGADVVAYITITNPDTPSINENYYLVYLFKPNGKGVYLSLGLGVNQFKEFKLASFNKEELNKIKGIASKFRNHVKNINDNDYESNLDFSKFSETCDLESDKNRAKAYCAANIYCKYYEFNEDKNIFLPSKSELENDLSDFIELYQYFSNHNDYFNEIKDSDFQVDESEENETTTKVYDTFYDYLLGNGYYFDGETIENYLLSLKVKPFVILTGNSGTGKTKLSQLFAQYLNDKNNYKIIPVGANWTENRHILGYYNILNNEPQYTPAYYLIKHSQEKSYPHFLILDEMNLSHVERYFADFLSAIESKETIPLAHKKEGLELPNNLFIIGTVNVDETTYMFSPKVLDRANTLEFKTLSAKDYMADNLDKTAPNGNINYLEDVLKGNEIQKMSIKELEKVFDNSVFWEELSSEIFHFQNILKDARFDFGFRVINEITRFMAVAYIYEDKEKDWNWKRYFDAQIKQKILPKLHGSQKVIGETLDKLLEACEDYPTSKAKIKEMQNVLDKQRYVSFIN